MGLKPISVGQLNNYIGRVLKTDPILGNVSVLGEISNLKFHSSGHVYFSLKDESSKISCFLAAGNLRNITCPIEEGMEIIATGYISVYERGGYYSLNIMDIEVNGAGQLAEKFEALKRKLEAEGLFSSDHKKDLPQFPECIAVVTSETGAAVRDIVRTVKNKNNYTDILIFPVLVQGPSAAADISSTIDRINIEHSNIDLIITGRGGGSIEELWAFNEEIVARSIFSSEIPVISAVGHETDFTIADFVADFRAATPTAAAEMAVPNISEINERLDSLALMIKNDIGIFLDNRRIYIENRNPSAFAQTLSSRIAYEQVNADRLVEFISNNIKQRISYNREKAEILKELIEASNPKSILSRGYSVIRDKSGNIISSSKQMTPGQDITIETVDGNADAEIISVN